MSKAVRFEELIAWQEARKLTQSIYEMTTTASFKNDSGLSSQLQRAAVSAMSNIAEGFGCDSMKEFGRFLTIARRSSIEVQSLLYTALDARLIDKSQFESNYARAHRTSYTIARLKSSLPITP